MRDIEPVSTPGIHGYGPSSPEIVDRAVRVVTADLRTGCSYRAADLYNRYLDYCTERRLKPVHPVGFGKGMRRFGAVPCIEGGGRSRLWYLPTAEERLYPSRSAS